MVIDKNKNFMVSIVLYNEDNKFKDKIDLLVKNNYSVYIYDNSPDSKYAREYLKDTDKIKYYTAGKNVGLGISMSTLASQAYYYGYKYMFFLDQDTILSNETLNFIDKLTAYNDIDKYTALSISNDNCTDLKNINYNEEINIKDVLLIRNSGSLFNLKNLKKIDWFDISFFVDGVDYEFSLRSSLNGYSVGLIKNVPGFDHVSGQGYSKYNFLGFNLINRKYSLNRMKDIFISSSRLISRSFFTKKFNFFYIILRNTITFFLLQLLIRLSKKENNEK